MMRKFFLLTMMCLVVILPACWNQHVEKKTGLVIVNVLDKKLYDDCHIKDSIHISFDKIKDEAPKKIDTDAQVVVYCSNYMCASSSVARKQLLDMGYKNVFVYEGGTAEWLQKGFPVIGNCNEGYLKVTLERSPKKIESYILTAEKLKAKMDIFKNKR